MQKHTKIYFDFFCLYPDDFIPCEVCGAKAVDIHHIMPRSKFGRKLKKLQDLITNLIALCRSCHDKAHREQITKDDLTAIVNKRKDYLL